MLLPSENSKVDKKYIYLAKLIIKSVYYTRKHCLDTMFPCIIMRKVNLESDELHL